jgi:hypothetical protein
MDRVELHTVFGKQPLQAWRIAGVPYWQQAVVSVGRLADGRWYASHTKVPGGAYVATDEQTVRAIADDWLTDGARWIPTPASYDGDGLPADGRRWRKSGADWFLDE